MINGKVPEDVVGQGDMFFKEASDRYIVQSRERISVGQVKNYEQAQMQLLRSFGEKAKLSTIILQFREKDTCLEKTTELMFGYTCKGSLRKKK